MNKRLLLVGFFCFWIHPFSFGQSIADMTIEARAKTMSYYPSLKNAQIKTRIRTKGSAMSASYTWWSIFKKPEKRQYYVNINKEVKGKFICYQFDHLEQQSRYGVFGHELSHIECFHKLNFFGFLKFIINQGLPNGIRRSERATDYATIKNGLGYELRAWSNETRTSFAKSNPGQSIPAKFGGRYLTPPEIDSVMKQFPAIYPEK